jgi:hypothetical protein
MRLKIFGPSLRSDSFLVCLKESNGIMAFRENRVAQNRTGMSRIG